MSTSCCHLEEAPWHRRDTAEPTQRGNLTLQSPGLCPTDPSAPAFICTETTCRENTFTQPGLKVVSKRRCQANREMQQEVAVLALSRVPCLNTSLVQGCEQRQGQSPACLGHSSTLLHHWLLLWKSTGELRPAAEAKNNFHKLRH